MEKPKRRRAVRAPESCKVQAGRRKEPWAGRLIQKNPAGRPRDFRNPVGRPRQGRNPVGRPRQIPFGAAPVPKGKQRDP